MNEFTITYYITLFTRSEKQIKKSQQSRFVVVLKKTNLCSFPQFKKPLRRAGHLYRALLQVQLHQQYTRA